MSVQPSFVGGRGTCAALVEMSLHECPLLPHVSTDSGEGNMAEIPTHLARYLNTFSLKATAFKFECLKRPLITELNGLGIV